MRKLAEDGIAFLVGLFATFVTATAGLYYGVDNLVGSLLVIGFGLFCLGDILIVISVITRRTRIFNGTV